MQTTYDKDSDPVSLSFLGQSLSYERDALGLASRIGDVRLAYDPNGIQTRIDYPDGTSEQSTFDAAYNITKIQTADETLDYTHDKVGRITSKNSVNYAYDAIGRLTQANAQSFRYDIVGNILNNNATYDTTNNRFLSNDLYTVTYRYRGQVITIIQPKKLCSAMLYRELYHIET